MQAVGSWIDDGDDEGSGGRSGGRGTSGRGGDFTSGGDLRWSFSRCFFFWTSISVNWICHVGHVCGWRNELDIFV